MTNSLRFVFVLSLVHLLAGFFCVSLQGQTDKPAPLEPSIAAASDDAELAISSFKYPDSVTPKLFAAEPMVANPVAFHVDVFGNVYVCETFRQEYGVEDNRQHPEWLNEDLASESVQDRIDYIRKHEKEIKKGYHDRDDRVRLLIDTDNDGVADESSVFSDGYNAIEDGTGAGFLRVGDDFFYTNIPHLWRLRDSDGDGVVEQREKIHSGFGVRFAFRGHDLHGLIIGPDRRLYFSIGDRGYNVSSQIKDPVSGAVFSCELDGSDLQVFATGLRNPQELAFDDYGNLFTGDNNSDSGDKARWVFVVPGGDSGWRMYYQYVPDRGPFNREKIWHPYNDDTPAYIVPPIDNLGDGPSGLAYYPGTGMDKHFRDRFFLCDFRGSSGFSGVRSFRLKPKGAGFEIVDSEKTIWNVLATDVEFGPNGTLYVSDWVQGWQGIGKGRIYSFENKNGSDAEIAKQVQTILEKGLSDRADHQLVKLLGHQDRRVRYAAQFELEDRKGVESFLSTFLDSNPMPNLLRQIHSIWGLGNLSRRTNLFDNLSEQNAGLLKLLISSRNKSTELKAQLAGLLAAIEIEERDDLLIKFAGDQNDRVKYHAALAIGKLGDEKFLPAIQNLLENNKDADPFLRHAGIVALESILKHLDRSRFKEVLSRLQLYSSSSVRLATVVALRRLESESVVRFLDDGDPKIVLEAARAIHDVPPGTWDSQDPISKLASLIDRPRLSDPLVRRVINANMILGGEASANALAEFASNSANPSDRRIDAIRLLSEWTEPNPIDNVLGDWRPLTGNRDAVAGQLALTGMMESGLSDNRISQAYLKGCRKAKVRLEPDQLEAIINKNSDNPELQAIAMDSLRSFAPEVFRQLLESKLEFVEDFPTAWIKLVAEIGDSSAVEFAQRVIGSNTNIERKREAIRLLGDLAKGENADSVLAELVADIKDDSLAAELYLDAIQAAEQSGDPKIRSLLDTIYVKAANGTSMIPYSYAMFGGDAEKGRKIFAEKVELSCLRCHTIGSSGGNVGPNLSNVGQLKNREYLLESIVDPNKTIAEGFTELIILTFDGEIVTGIKKFEDEDTIALLNKDAVLVRVAKENIDGQKKGQSSMPTDLIGKMNINELRDLIEYLAQQKSETLNTGGPAGH